MTEQDLTKPRLFSAHWCEQELSQFRGEGGRDGMCWEFGEFEVQPKLPMGVCVWGGGGWQTFEHTEGQKPFTN